ncbi:MAG TPA: ribosome biogenesis GTP-binding protein YihA/YsxC [Polyangiaceae bacterium]|nr:ribosome biogenesis GTP-binding protein YihA/YsxC [Polyangiaceae bacterium]
MTVAKKKTTNPKKKAFNPKWTCAEAEFIAGVAEPDQMPPPALAEIAFGGRSNVGKSSLLNALVGRKGLVRTGATPGTTRQLNLFRVKAADGLEIVLVDLPGYGFAKRAKHEKARWGTLIEHYIASRVTLRAVVLLIDARRGAEDEERDLIAYVKSLSHSAERPLPAVIVVATKLDKLPSAHRRPAVLRIARDLGCRAYGFSSPTGDGKMELWTALRSTIVRGKKADLEAEPDDA